MPEGRLVREIEFGGQAYWQVVDDRLFAGFAGTDPQSGHRVYRLRSWGLQNGVQKELGELDLTALGTRDWMFDPGGGALVYSKADRVYLRPLPITAGVSDTVLARHSSDGIRFWDWGRPQGLYSYTGDGEVIVWTTPDGTSAPGRRLRKPESAAIRLQPEADGRWAVSDDFKRREGKVLLWDLEALAFAQPVELRRSGSWYFSFVDFQPGCNWIVASTHTDMEMSFWPLPAAFPAVVDGYDTFNKRPVEFTSDGRYLVTNWGQDRVRMWPIPGGEDLEVVDLMLPRAIRARTTLAIDHNGEHVLSMGQGDGIFLLSSGGEEPRQLKGFPPNDGVYAGAFSPSGQLVAAANLTSDSEPTLRVWDLETGEVWVFDLPQRQKDSRVKGWDKDYYVWNLAFINESTLYTDGYGLLRWDLETGSYDQILRAPPGSSVGMLMTSDRRKMLSFRFEELAMGTLPADLQDLDTGETRRLVLPAEWTSLNLDSEGLIWVTGGEDGVIHVGRTEGGAEHVLAGHVGPVSSVVISPDRKWIASAGEDKTLRLWPMPDLSKPPLHTLPREELIAKLKTLTNLRAVRDEESSTGWKLEVGPFPGWETVPEW